MIVRTLIDNEDRYTVVTNNGKNVLISTQCYSTASVYDKYARKNIDAQTIDKFERYVHKHKKYWRDGFDGLLEEYGLEHVHKK